MKYLEKTFSVPVGGKHISQRQWDYATLTREEFAAKYAYAGHGIGPTELPHLSAEEMNAMYPKRKDEGPQ